MIQRYFFLINIQIFIIVALLIYGCNEDIGSPDDDDKLYPMSWEGVDHYYGYQYHFLNLTELLGPKGAKVSKLIPGKYVAKGRYDVSSSIYSEDLRITMLAPWPSDSVSTFMVTENQLKGEFETYCIIERPPSDEDHLVIEFLSGGTLIDEIIPYDETRQKDDIDPVLEMLAPVALGQGVTEAAEYTQSTTSSRKLGLLSWEGDPFSTWNDSLPSEWFPSEIGKVQLVAILNSGTELVQECKYTDGFIVKRYKRLLYVTLREARKGNIVAETTLTGDAPNACPSSVEHQPTETQRSIYGNSVQYVSLENWLEAYIIP